MRDMIFPRVHRPLLRNLILICLALLTASLTGCITFLTEIRLNGDGSGTMVQTMTMNPQQMQETMEGVAKQMGATMTEAKPADAQKEPPAKAEQPVKEDELKGKAADMGQGVTVLKIDKIDTKTAAGVRVTYAFKDINQLSMNPKPEAALGIAGAGASSKDAMKFRFRRLPNGNALLTVILPADQKKASEETPAAAPAAMEESAESLAMARQMFKGLRMGVAIDVAGKVVKTSSPYREGSKVTLMDIDFDPLLSDEKKFRELNAKMDAAKGDDRKMMEMLKGFKGIKIITAQEVSIEFTPSK